MAMALIVSMLLFMLWVTLFSRFRLLVRGLFLQVNLAMFIFLPFHIIFNKQTINHEIDCLQRLPQTKAQKLYQ